MEAIRPTPSHGRSSQVAQESEAKGVPDHLQPDGIAPAMQALKKWEAADSQNAAPVALEVQLLSAVGHDDEALSRWEAAARRPKVDLHLFETYSALAGLLTRMGMPEPEAHLDHGRRQLPGEPDHVREAPPVARVAEYEGALAACKDATRRPCGGGSHLRVRAYHAGNRRGTHSVWVGNAIEGIGAAYDWRWYPRSSVVGLHEAPLMCGAIYYGTYHDWYAHHVNPREDAELCDRLVLAKLRSQAARERNQDIRLERTSQELLAPLEFSLTALFCFLLFLIVYVSARPWRRDGAEEATRLREPVSVLIALLALAPRRRGSSMPSP